MANWSNPTVTRNYLTEVLQDLAGKDEDSATMFLNAPTNQPVGSIKYLRASNKFQEWDGAVWNDKVIAIAGGGTGGATAAAARTALGLGDLAIVNAPLTVAQGGTSSATASAARTNLGLGTLAIINSPLSIGDGGTTSTTAAQARSNLGVILPGASAYDGSGDQGISIATEVVLSFQNEIFDTEAAFNTATSKYTAPVTDRYFINIRGQVYLNTEGSLRYAIRVYKNTTTKIYEAIINHASGLNPISFSVPFFCLLNAGDVVDFRIQCDSSVANVKKDTGTGGVDIIRMYLA